jgi:hypothetical protein
MRTMLVVAGLLAVGCVTTTSGGIRVRSEEWRHSAREIAFKAQADLGSCAERGYVVLEELKLVPVKAGVTGCGIAAVYERKRNGRVTYKHGGSWELVSRSTPATYAAGDLKAYR